MECIPKKTVRFPPTVYEVLMRFYIYIFCVCYARVNRSRSVFFCVLCCVRSDSHRLQLSLREKIPRFLDPQIHFFAAGGGVGS